MYFCYMHFRLQRNEKSWMDVNNSFQTAVFLNQLIRLLTMLICRRRLLRNLKLKVISAVLRRNQEATQKEISQLENKVNSLLATKNAGLGTEETDVFLTKLQKQLDEQRKTLKIKELNANRQKNFRDVQRSKLVDVCDKIPEAAEILKEDLLSVDHGLKVTSQIYYK